MTSLGRGCTFCKPSNVGFSSNGFKSKYPTPPLKANSPKQMLPYSCREVDRQAACSILAFGPNAVQSVAFITVLRRPQISNAFHFYCQTFRFIGCYSNGRGRASVGGTLGRRSPVTGSEPATSNIPSTDGLYIYLRSELPQPHQLHYQDVTVISAHMTKSSSTTSPTLTLMTSIFTEHLKAVLCSTIL